MNRLYVVGAEGIHVHSDPIVRGRAEAGLGDWRLARTGALQANSRFLCAARFGMTEFYLWDR